MSADVPDRSDTPDDLAQAYAKAHALASDGRGPSAAVRANVLAAARAVAAEAAARVDAGSTAPVATPPPLTPVAPPVADVGRGRPKAVNLSSWRIRSGAALAAMLLVGVAGWHFDSARRADNGEQVAMAELRLAAPQTAPVAHELPAPAVAAASFPYVPPPVVEEPADNARRPLAKQSTRDKDEVVAQVDLGLDRKARAVVAPTAVVPAPKPPPMAAPPAPGVLADARTSAAVGGAYDAAPAKAPATEQDPVTVTIKAAPTQFATAPPQLPSVVPRRVVVPPPAAPVADTARQRDTVVAAAAPAPETGLQRVEIAGSRIARVDAEKKSVAGATGSLVSASARALPTSLHTAADRGDVESLRMLLANPANPVDAPDAAGRTALLHAVLAQQAAAVRVLLAAGADPARADQSGQTPRAAAQAGASAEIAALLAAPR